MKRQIFYIFLLAILLVPAVFAAETNTLIAQPAPETQPAGMDRMIMPPGNPVQSPNFLGQDQYYSVTFRGNGEAVISMKAVFSNMETADMTTVSFKSPKIKPEEIVAYQVQREGQCIEYERQTITDLKTLPITPECISFQEPDYSMGYYYGKTSYLKAEVVTAGEMVTVTLPKAVASNKSGSIILYYRGMGYATKNVFGAYNYTFETLKTDDNIRLLQVGINTDSDLMLKDSQGAVNYAPTMESARVMSSAQTSDTGFSGAQFDNFYQQIGYGMLVKTASNLKADESYTVSGSYAKSNWQLYGKEITLAIIIPLVLILLVGIPLIRVFKKMRSSNSVLSGKNSIIIVGVGFLTALVLGIFAGVIFVLSSYAQMHPFYYQSGVSIIFFLIAASIYLLLLVCPSLIVGYKRGVWVGVLTGVSTIVWLVIGLVITAIILLQFNGQQNYPGQFMRAEPAIMMDSGTGSGAAPSVQSAPDVDIQQVELK